MKGSHGPKIQASRKEISTELYRLPREHWTRIRTNNVLERIMREIRRRTRVVGNFPDGQSAVMLVAARLRHIAGTPGANASTLTWSDCAKRSSRRPQ